MQKTREIVTGTYIDNNTYELRREDGSLFLTIVNGIPFTVGDKEWMPVKIPRKNGIGTILSCRRFGRGGIILDEFILVPNKKGLWALNSISAEKGIFHKYSEPKDDLDEYFMENHLGTRVVKYVDKIDIILECGGRIGKHETTPFGYKVYTDGIEEKLTTSEEETMEEHTISSDSTYQVRVSEATYLIHTQIWQKKSNKRIESTHKVMLTPEANRNIVLRKLMRISKERMRR